MRLIDAEKLPLEPKEANQFIPYEYASGWNDMLLNVLKAEQIDAVPVVRCKDCKYCINAHGDGFMYCMRPIEAPDYSETGYCYPLEVRVGFYGFCSYGERKEGGDLNG